MEDLLKVRELKVYYETKPSPLRAVDEVDLNVRKHEIFGIVGESACGKTTLAQAILRLVKPPGRIVQGEVLFKGIDLMKLRDDELRTIRWRQISYIPQSSMNALNPVMKIIDQIADVIKMHEGELSKAELEHRVEDLLISVGLAREVAKMYPHELSGGMRQRAVIAMALALHPELLIADEPTTALDVVVQRGIIQLLKDINKDFGTTIILITHDMAVHGEIADRNAVMYAGKIVEVGSSEKIFSEPLHPYTRFLISSIPYIGEKRKLLGIPGLPPDLRNPPPGCRFHPRCPFYMRGKCDTRTPALIEVGQDRMVACYLYGG